MKYQAMRRPPSDDQLIEGQCWRCGKTMKDIEQATPYECVTCEATLSPDTPTAGDSNGSSSS